MPPCVLNRCLLLRLAPRQWKQLPNVIENATKNPVKKTTMNNNDAIKSIAILRNEMIICEKYRVCSSSGKHLVLSRTNQEPKRAEETEKLHLQQGGRMLCP